MSKPVIMVIDDAVTAATLEKDLGRRFGGDYRVVAEAMPAGGLASLERVRAAVSEWLC